MHYTLKYKNLNLAVFRIKTVYVDKCVFNKMYVEHLPLPLKRLLKKGQFEEFILDENELFYELNEDGCTLFDIWLANREIPVNRFHYSEYISKTSTPRQWLLKNNGYSFTDSYWIESEEGIKEWDGILDIRRTLDTFYLTKDKNNRYKGHTSTLGGQLEKFWFNKNGEVYLCKKADPSYDILIAREYIASMIYQKQGYKNFCEYKLLYKDNYIVGCICKNFIEEGQDLISAYDLLEEYNLTQSPNVWDYIIEKANQYGLDKSIVSDYLDIQIIVDFLISNRDRHQSNIAFIRDEDSGIIIKPAPIFDNGSSKYMEHQHPESLYRTTVNGLYNTEMECLQHVSNFNLIDISKLPKEEELRNTLESCQSVSPNRKDNLLTMYRDRVNFLKEIQLIYNRRLNIKEFIQARVEQSHDLESEIFFDFAEDW